jgi:hypothetical protein
MRRSRKSAAGLAAAISLAGGLTFSLVAPASATDQMSASAQSATVAPAVGPYNFWLSCENDRARYPLAKTTACYYVEYPYLPAQTGWYFNYSA